MSTSEVRSNDAERNAGVAKRVVVGERIRDEVLATYAAYLAAFIASDISAIDRLVQYPLAYIGHGKATLVDSTMGCCETLNSRLARLEQAVVG